jgi:hypothetical protein
MAIIGKSKAAAAPSISLQNTQVPLDTGALQNAAKAGSEPKPTLHFYSRQIAEELNPKQHDVAAAALIYNLSLWQDNNYKQTRIDGKRYCFRSLTDLEKDCPYLTKSGIHKALKRLEEKLGDQFKIKRDEDKLWFSIGDETMAKLRVKGLYGMSAGVNTMNSFYSEDAIKTGSIRSAVLLQNLKYQLKNFARPNTDAHGNKYGELSPKKLCAILKFSEDTIQRSLANMCKKGYLIRHPTAQSFFALPEGFKSPQNTETKEKQQAAEVHAQAAEVHIRTAEIHSQAADVHSDDAINPSEYIDDQSIAKVEKVTCINESCNKGENEGFKDCYLTETASQLCQPSLMSNGLKILSDLAEETLSKMQSDQSAKSIPATVQQDELPYDLIDPHEMPYDHESEGQIRFQSDLDDEITLLKNFFRIKEHKVTADDESKFRRFMTDNPKIESLNLIELYEQMSDPLVIAGNKKSQKRKRILQKARTPKQFLKYMPQIIHLLHWDGDEEEGGHDNVKIDPPFDALNYAYMGRAPNSSIVVLDDGTVPTEYVDD